MILLCEKMYEKMKEHLKVYDVCDWMIPKKSEKWQVWEARDYPLFVVEGIESNLGVDDESD